MVTIRRELPRTGLAGWLPHNVIEDSPPLAGSSADSFTPGDCLISRGVRQGWSCGLAQFQSAFGFDADGPNEAGELARQRGDDLRATSTRRRCELPVLVMAPRRIFGPLECSEGTIPV